MARRGRAHIAFRKTPIRRAIEYSQERAPHEYRRTTRVEYDPSIISPNVHLHTDIHIDISFSGEEEEEDSRVRRTRVGVDSKSATMAARD
jgi:hypothetical protein